MLMLACGAWRVGDEDDQVGRREVGGDEEEGGERGGRERVEQYRKRYLTIICPLCAFYQDT